MKKSILLALITVFLTNHAFAETDFDLAIKKAALHQPGIAAKPLTTIDGPFVRMTTFTTYPGYKTSDTTLGATIWTTVDPDVKKLCAQYAAKNKGKLTSHQLSVWIAQLLGIPATNADKRRFVILEIPVIQAYYGESPSDIGIFRPCTDPRIGPHNDGTFICPKQMNAADTNIASDFKTWFINNSIASYTLDHGMPWTEYGYTYNWNKDTSSVYGVSEFIVLKNTPVIVLPNPNDSTTVYMSAEEYCR